MSKFDVITGEQVKSTSKAPSYTKVFANSLIKLAKDKNIVAITAAMPSGTGLDIFEKEFPKELLMLELPNNMLLLLQLVWLLEE